MAKKKPVDPVENQSELPEKEVGETLHFDRITSQEQAEEFVEAGNFAKQKPAGVNMMFVTTDANAFWPKDLGACNTHCRKFGLKKFAVNI